MTRDGDNGGVMVGWAPADYVDETVPTLRASPSDWLVRGAEGIGLAPFDLEPGEALSATDDIHVLAQGETVMFTALTEFGDATMTIAEDGSFSVDRPMPPDARTCSLDNDTSGETIEELVEAMRTWGDDTAGRYVVAYYAWSDDQPFTLRGDAFVARDDAGSGA